MGQGWFDLKSFNIECLFFFGWPSTYMLKEKIACGNGYASTALKECPITKIQHSYKIRS